MTKRVYIYVEFPKAKAKLDRDSQKDGRNTPVVTKLELAMLKDIKLRDPLSEISKQFQTSYQDCWTLSSGIQGKRCLSSFSLTGKLCPPRPPLSFWTASMLT